LHDLNTEFLAPDASANFLKPVMQVGQPLAQTGKNGPSIFPNAGLAARLKYTPTEVTYLSAAIFDGVPGNTAHPYASRVDLHKGDGGLLVAEAGWTPQAHDDDMPHKIAVGTWAYTNRADDLVDLNSAGNPVKRRARGAYFLSHCQFYNDPEKGRALTAFFRSEIGDGDTAPVKWSYETGLVGSGWMPTRPSSEIGIGIAQAHAGSKYIRSVAGVADKDEYSMELYYRDTVYRGVRLQPDVQYIVNPGIDTVTRNSTVIGIRTDINFLRQDTEKQNDL
jgi:porin